MGVCACDPEGRVYNFLHTQEPRQRRGNRFETQQSHPQKAQEPNQAVSVRLLGSTESVFT